MRMFIILIMNKHTKPKLSRVATDTGVPEALPPVIPVSALLGQRGCVWLEHGGEHYQLRVTRNGKLILTK